MIRKVLVPIRDDGKCDVVLSHAIEVAKRFGAHLDVTHCRPLPTDFLPYGIPIPSFLRDQVVEQARELADANEAGLREVFDRSVANHGIQVTDGLAPQSNGQGQGQGATASWVEETGKQVDVIKAHGRLTDLIIVAKPDRDRNLGTNTLKAALFNTARPVLMCPGTVSEVDGGLRRVAFAWNGSLEAVRALGMCQAFLQAADQVTILTAAVDPKTEAMAADLAEYLAARGIEAAVDAFEPSAKQIGADLLARAKAAGADTLIMGAYGDSHERETLFGGNTQTVVDTASMPVIMVH